MIKKSLAAAISSVLGLSVLGISQVAFAEEKSSEDASPMIEEVVATGSRIKRADLQGANPVTIISREDMTNIGLTSVGEVLQSISSSAGGATNTGVNNGGSGAVRFSLRGLGEERTLVLVNGKRVVASGLGANKSVDLNNIPVAMIERVEVLKDGASAVYGSDAIAGVVNIITRDNFEGVDLNVMSSVTAEGDGQENTADLTIGTSGENGSVVVSVNYAQQKPIWAGDRDHSQSELWYHPYWDPTGVAVGGSSAPPWGNYNTADGRVTHGPDFGTDYRPYSGATDSYNYAPANYIQTPNERWGFSMFSDYNLGDLGALQDVTVSLDGWFTHRESQRLIAPEPLAPLVFFGHPAPISTDNYYNQTFGPQDADGNPYEIADWRRRMVETGGRDQLHETDTYQVSFSLDGEVGDGWGWEMTGQYGENNANTIDIGYFNLERVAEAVGPTFFDAAGELRCGTGPDDMIAGCVPLNPFGIPGTDTAITQEMLQYISTDYISLTEGGNEMYSVGFHMNQSELFALPAGPVGIAFGVEKRHEEGFNQPDSLQIQGITTAGSAVPTRGSYKVDEAYVELNIPLLSDLPLAELLELNVATRFSDYSTYGSTTTSKVGLRLVVNDELTLRGTVSEAFRAPSIPELHDGAETTFPEAVDPCADDPSPSCVAGGVPAGGYDDDGLIQIPTKVGGNKNLQPETADIFTFGLVYQPSWLESASFTLDYYDVELNNTIDTVGAQIRLDECHDNGSYCDTIDRFGAGSGAEGQILFIWDLNENIGAITTSGVDMAFNWSPTLGDFGDLDLHIESTYVDEYDEVQANGSVLSHAGMFWDNSSGQPGNGNFARWKSSWSANWQYDNYSVSYRGRYISEVGEVINKWFSEEPTPRTVDSVIYHDLVLGYSFENYKVSFGVENMLDQEAPFVYSGFNDNTDPRSYDTHGRSYWLKLSAGF